MVRLATGTTATWCPSSTPREGMSRAAEPTVGQTSGNVEVTSMDVKVTWVSERGCNKGTWIPTMSAAAMHAPMRMATKRVKRPRRVGRREWERDRDTGYNEDCCSYSSRETRTLRDFEPSPGATTCSSSS